MSICWPRRCARVGRCGLDGNDTVVPVKMSAKATPIFCGGPAGSPSEVHDAAHALDHEVVAGVAGFRACLSEARYGAIHETWIQGVQ